MSLRDYPVTAMLVAGDIERAKRFYEEKLGLELVETMPGVAIFEAGRGTQVLLYEREGGSLAEHAVLGFDVDDLDQVLSDLLAKGVMQDTSGLPEGSDASGIMDYGPVRSAWIKDSEGNVIGINEMKGGSAEGEDDDEDDTEPEDLLE